MKRAITACLAAGLVGYGVPAAADPLELGGWLGPRVFSNNSRLGQRDVEKPDNLTSALQLGARVGWPLLRGRLIPEAELTFAVTQTSRYDVGVFWFEPRLAVRYLLNEGGWLRPFVLIGGGAPISLSGNTDSFANHILGEGFLGGGVAISTGKGFTLRVDARLAFLPGEDPGLAAEVEIGVGVSLPLGGRSTKARVEVVVSDRDRDGIEDGKDGCPTRPEDKDGVEDEDGCPDIDNDLDGVLDIADACSLQPESYNGFQDDDGCPDSVPPELAAIVGPIAGVTFAPGAEATIITGALASSFDNIAKIVLTHPSVRILLVGHADNAETTPELQLEGEPEPTVDPATLATDLGYARASNLREMLIARGVPAARISSDSRGAEEPAGDNTTNAGRQANRRVELKLLVPQR